MTKQGVVLQRALCFQPGKRETLGIINVYIRSVWPGCIISIHYMPAKRTVRPNVYREELIVEVHSIQCKPLCYHITLLKTLNLVDISIPLLHKEFLSGPKGF